MASVPLAASATNSPAGMRFEDRTQSRPHNVNYSLPLLNGIEATRQIRKRQPQTEVLIFTMHDEEILIRSVLEARAPGYLPKADAKRYVVAAVEALAERKPFFTARVSRTLLASFLGKTSAASDHVLSPREESVIKLIAKGHGNADVLYQSQDS
jgi:DNA-binding NarL/FixJ family response regulator